MPAKLIMGEMVQIVHGSWIRTRDVLGPRGGTSRRYQLTSRDPVRDPWFRSVWEATEERESDASAKVAEDRLVRDHVRYLLSKRN